MPDASTLAAFLLAAAMFAYMPGPATLYAAAQTLANGRRGGLLAALGLHLGGYAHVVAASLGLAALFTAIPTLYIGFKMVGAAYLIWLGLSWLGLFNRDELAPTTVQTQTSLWQSIVVEVLNPKTALFYLAFLPQFSDPSVATPIWLQLLLLGTVVNLLFSSADLLCVFLADRVTQALSQSGAATRWTRRLGGGTLIGLGVHLGLSR